MKQLTLKDIILVFTKYLNFVDDTLSEHCEDVSYILLKMLQSQNKYSQEEIINLCTLAMFHDIGAYKKETPKDFKQFEILSPHDHSIYGSLFIKYFSPLSPLADIILYHHVSPSDFSNINSDLIDEIILFNFIDRIAIQLRYTNQNIDTILETLNIEEAFTPLIKKFIDVNKKTQLVEKLYQKKHKQELYQLFECVLQSRSQVIEYAKMLNYTIDFQSESTVNHTITVTSLSKLLALKLNLDPLVIEKITLGATLHDIGKITIPLHILEKPGKLNEEEMLIMKQHVTATYEILKDIGFTDIVEIACFHHEKLDGSGYPFGLNAKQLSTPVRVVIIADILSALIGSRSYKKEFSKDKVIAIMSDMVQNNKIDSTIFSIVKSDYDELIKRLNQDCKEVFTLYKQFKLDYKNLLYQFYEIFD